MTVKKAAMAEGLTLRSSAFEQVVWRELTRTYMYLQMGRLAVHDGNRRVQLGTQG